jgi:hypothetical protein
MNSIERLSRQARRRLAFTCFLQKFPYCFAGYFALAALAIGISKVWAIPVDGKIWLASWIAVASLATIIHSFILVKWNTPSVLHSAIEVDRRFGLRERLSSALSLSPDQLQSPLGMALQSDAQRQAERIDIRDRFEVRLSKGSLLPLVPMLALTAMLWLPDAKEKVELAENANKQLTVQQMKNSTQPLLEQIRKKREEAEDKGLKETAELFKQLEGQLEKLQKEGKLEKAEALSKFNDLKKQLEERRKEVGGGENLQKNLEKLKNLSDGPAEKMAKAMEQADFDMAKQEMERLKEQLQKGELSEEQKQQLSKQLEQLEKGLKDAAKANEQAKKELQQKIDAAKQAGDMQQAAEAQKELDNLNSMTSQMEKLQDIANKMSQAKESLQKGDQQAAAEQLQELSEEFGEMAEQMQENEQLEEMLEELDQSKESMTCEQCEGKGCSKCKSQNSGNKSNQQGKGSGKSSQGSKASGKGKGEGEGLGEGEGSGDRPEKETDTATFDSQIRDKMRKGETSFGGKVGGANRKGVSKEEVQDAIVNQQLEDPDALESEVLPRSRREQTREYFNDLRDGKKSDSAASDKGGR